MRRNLKRIGSPAWAISSEYESLVCPELRQDEETVVRNIKMIETALKPLDRIFGQLESGKPLNAADRRELVEALQKLAPLREETRVLIHNLKAYTFCEVSLDAKNEAAVAKSCEYTTLVARLEEITKSWELALEKAPAALVEEYLNSPATKGERFLLMQRRVLSETSLSSGEEKMIAALRPSGHEAWGELYEAIAGTLKCRVGNKEVGLAEAIGILRSSDENERQSAWTAIQSAWETQKQPCAAILNSLANWRLELVRKRSHKQKIDFLFHPLHSNRVSRETVETMFAAVQERVETPRRALKLVADVLGKSKLDPWDLMAPPPVGFGSRTRTFDEGFEMIISAFNATDPEMGKFARQMLENRWIEARVLPNKRQGAYCLTFSKSRTPRVFQTYMGTMFDIQTLAHELGHAYHAWIVRDLPLQETFYPLTLAETASLFGETVFAEYVMRHTDAASGLEMAWQDATNTALFLLNLPARFTFEKEFYETRAHRPVSPDELCALTDKAWRHWFGDSLSKPESMYWASKLHFSIATTSFYNFPYTFGYLFSLGIFAQREKLGERFNQVYRELLRDTGRMSAEELVYKHLGQDITKPEFWLRSLDVVHGKVDAFAKLLKSKTKKSA